MSQFIVTYTPYFKKSVLRELLLVDPNISIVKIFTDGKMLVNSSFDGKEFTQKLIVNSPIFIKHIMPVQTEGKIVADIGKNNNNILSVVNKIAGTMKGEKFAVQCRIVTEGKKGHQFTSKDIEVFVGEAYYEKGNIPSFSDFEILNEEIKVISIFIFNEMFYIGFSTSSDNLNFHSDEYRICSKSGREISRAENKLKEASKF